MLGFSAIRIAFTRARRALGSRLLRGKLWDLRNTGDVRAEIVAYEPAFPHLQGYRINTVNAVRRQLRSWTDLEGRTWSLFFREEEGYRPGALLVFTGDPKDGMGSPKILVRGLRDVYSVPDPTLPFYFQAAAQGGFVWLDRDGTPWHIWNRTRMQSGAGRRLELHHAGSHRSLWELSDSELETLVRMSTTEDPDRTPSPVPPGWRRGV